MLKCSFCRQHKEESEFYRQTSISRGYSYGCKECERRRKRVSPDKLGRKPNGSFNLTEYFKEYYQKNREHRLLKRKEYYNTPKGTLSSKLSEYKRRLLNKKSYNTITPEDIVKLLGLQENKCAKCSKEFSSTMKYTLDHIVPLSKGGNLTIDNTQLLCKSCNCSKGARTIQYRKDLVF